jgi:hypothetical protein
MRKILISFATLLLIGLPVSFAQSNLQNTKCYALALSSGDEAASY